MNEEWSAPHLTVNSLYANLEILLAELLPVNSRRFLGASWSFGLPRAGGLPATEYDLPLHPGGLSRGLEKRTGLIIRRHQGREVEKLYAHLAKGWAAIVAVDAYYLPYRPAFQRVHSSRTIIVRPGADGREVKIQDIWLPQYAGPLAVADLEKARHSEVPCDFLREPIFAGKALEGEWFSLRLANPAMLNSKRHLLKVFGTLFRDATGDHADEQASYGFGAFRRFIDSLPSGPGHFWEETGQIQRRRAASLLLRRELSSRVYLAFFLQAAALQLEDYLLAREVAIYFQQLRAMEMARDLLTKSLKEARPEFMPIIRGKLLAALAAEERLAEQLLAYADLGGGFP